MQLIAYYRVSTDRQGRSGLGLEAQRVAVATYTNANGGVIADYVEVESGKRCDRPELLKALAHCKRAGATLIVARLDRLLRNLAFLVSIRESGVEFKAADMPEANKFMIGIMALVAEYEADRISLNTKLALGAAKARGVKLGSQREGFWTPQQREAWKIAAAKGRATAAEHRHERSLSLLVDTLPAMRALREGGATYARIAAEMNAQNKTTPRGSAWSEASVWRALKTSTTPRRLQ
jgi:DNA invertase Pin-like site-specific DNA recombinase